MRNTDIKSSKKHQNHHQRPCCHILKGQHQKKDEEHKHQIIKIITKGLVVTLQPGQHQKKDQEHKHQIIKIHQNHHKRSCCHIAAGSKSKEGSGTQTSNHRNHHQRSCCHIAAGSTSKEGWGTQTLNHQNSSKIITKGLVVTLQPVNIKKRIRNTNIKSSKCIKIITKGLVVTLQPGQHQKKDQEHKHQITKIHQNHHQRSCCHIAAGSTSKEG